ncbi:MAG: ABC transporter ATP-binding protein [Rhodanobacter sp.]
MHEQGDSTRETAPDPAPSSSGLFDEIARLGAALKRLFGAQKDLLAAELGLARSAVSWLLLAGLAATVAGVGFGLTVLGLLGVLLAKWLGSWVWALLLLALLQLLFLFGAVLLFRRCMHWMSLPATRGQWGEMMRAGVRGIEAEAGAEPATPPHAARGEEGR